MGFGKFESAGRVPLGEGKEKRVFVHPNDERRVVAEGKESVEKETSRQRRGRYYLTKIVHGLLPENIPNIYQVGESVDGRQTADAERIAHSPGHEALQAALRTGEDSESAAQQAAKEVREGRSELDTALAELGLSFDVDTDAGNYTINESGNVNYLETFKPWQSDARYPNELEVLFGEDELREAIEAVEDAGVKAKCSQYLDRLLVLMEEEKNELRANHESSRVESDPQVELEQMLGPFLEGQFLANLHALQTVEEAFASEERKSVKPILIAAEKMLHTLGETGSSQEEYNRLSDKISLLARAYGIPKGNIIDHSRG
jgi:hypothetical protein